MPESVNAAAGGPVPYSLRGNAQYLCRLLNANGRSQVVQCLAPIANLTKLSNDAICQKHVQWSGTIVARGETDGGVHVSNEVRLASSR